MAQRLITRSGVAVAALGLSLITSCGSNADQSATATTVTVTVSASSGDTAPSDVATDGSATATGASGTATSDALGGDTLPFDGGSYTWSNGVKMTLKVVRVEPWGSRDDYCGDGSCGISKPDDLRWVLQYDVTAPDTLKAPFDASSCPGDLHIVNGNDDKSIIGVAGDYSHYLEGKIFPGATKFGTEEYSISKSALGQQFYIESTCGDTDYSGETAYFGGVIDAKS